MSEVSRVRTCFATRSLVSPSTRDLAEDAAVADDHLVTLLEGVLEGLELFLLLALRADHEEIHDDEHQEEEDPHGGAAARLALCRGLGLEKKEKSLHML